MKKQLDVFCEIPCLTDRSKQLNGVALQKKWFKSADKRIIGQYLQKFIDYNQDCFSFIGVRPFIIGTDQNTSLAFESSSFIGSIPLRSSDTGKQIGDFVISPRFLGRDRYQDYIEILDLLDAEINPTVFDSLPLISGRNFRPPLYLEAVKFIGALENLIKNSWRKFDTIEYLNPQPTGQTNWNKYINNQYKVENHLLYPSRRNILSEFHSEYSELRYVFDICKSELLSSNTPFRIKGGIRHRVEYIEEKFYYHKPKKTTEIPIKFSDSPTVKEAKSLANKILNFNLVESTAWRVDFSDVFEKYVQYIFRQVAKTTGGRLLSNYRFTSHTKTRYSWELKYLEPDAVFKKEDLIIMVDAKYKSHLLNKYDNSEKLKEDYRHDLHQILAYSSFGNQFPKCSFLCYPSDKVEIKHTIFKNSINDLVNKVVMIGIPLRKNTIGEVKKVLLARINEFEKEKRPANNVYSA